MELCVFMIISNGEELSDIVFECDSDCRNFAKDNVLKCKEKWNAHAMNNIVVWLNNHGNREPPGVISRDISKWLEEQLIKNLIKHK